MTAGPGWIALARVVFATWRLLRLLDGACVCARVSILYVQAQGMGAQVPSPRLAMMPYLATNIFPVPISRDQRKVHQNAPASLLSVLHAGP